MLTLVRHLACIAGIAAAIGCASAPSPRERVTSAEIAQMSSLKRTYSGIVMGFDVRDDTTIVVSLDLQTFIGMDDDAAAAMKRGVAERWRSAWSSAHPGGHATLHVRFIDFIGRKIAEQTIAA
jgi:predicted naringenin-chalcone synthase